MKTHFLTSLNTRQFNSKNMIRNGYKSWFAFKVIARTLFAGYNLFLFFRHYKQLLLSNTNKTKRRVRIIRITVRIASAISTRSIGATKAKQPVIVEILRGKVRCGQNWNNKLDLLHLLISRWSWCEVCMKIFNSSK